MLLDERKVDLGIEVSSEVKKILNGALSGNEVSLEEGITLFNAKDGDKLAVYKVADSFERDRVENTLVLLLIVILILRTFAIWGVSFVISQKEQRIKMQNG